MNEEKNNGLNYTVLFGGGAIRGLAYCGVVDALEELDVQYTRIAGSSVGSVFAGLVAAGYSANELKEVIKDVTFELFRDIQLALGPQFALSKGEVFQEWLRELIEKKYYGDSYKKGTHRAVTFKDLEKDLVIITTDLSNFECKEFSKFVTPDFEVASAIRISCGMPGLMKPVEYNNTVLVDGDLQKSAPMWSLTKNLQPENERILEIRLEGDFQGNDHNAVEFLNAIYSYATRTGTNFLKNLYGNKDKYDYIVIETGDVNIVDFNIPSEKREELINNGYNQIKDYFLTTLVEKKEKLLEIYQEINRYIEQISSDIQNQKILQAKQTLGELYIFLSDYLGVISEVEKNNLNEFKDIFLQNIVYPTLFGKVKLKNEKLVQTSLNLCKDNITSKITEYESYINRFKVKE